MIGSTLSHFRITAKIGKGGMGEVYRARDTKLGRDVALKILPEAVAADPGRLARFEREAKAIAALNHPNIVTLHGIEDAAGRRFLIMELVEGESLDRRIPRNGFALDDFLGIAIPIADALAATHDQGIIHRDLKPANVMITTKGVVKLLDFGLAKLAEVFSVPRQAPSDEDETETAFLTQEGSVLGTTAYMSPEQLRGQKVDARSDVFALGILLFEMATGSRPFKGATVMDLASSILTSEPRRLKEKRADLPRQLGRIIQSCLQKSPDSRFQTARDVHNQLEALRRESATSPEPRPLAQARQRTSLRAVVVAALVMVALGTGIYYLGGSRASHDARPSTTDIPSLKLEDYASSAEALMENFGDPEALEMSIEAWEKVTELDPDYAPALAGLANARTLIAWNSRPDPELLDQAEQDAEAAMRLDPELGLPYATLTFLFSMRGLYDTAQEMSRRSLELAPDDPWVLQMRARFLIDMFGRFREAEELATRATEIDPAFFPAFFQLGWARMELLRFEEAEAAFRRAVELRPDFSAGYLGLGIVLGRTARQEEAIDAFATCLELDPDSTQCLLWGGLAYDNQGLHDAARGSFRKISQQNPDHPLAGYALLYEAVELGHLGRAEEQAVVLQAAEKKFKANSKMWFNLKGLAGVAAQRGEPEVALAWLRQAAEAGLRSFFQVRSDPSLRPLDGDPRFEAILDSLRPG